MNLLHTWAIVVGIETYGLGPDWGLEGPAKDARRFAQWLEARGVPQRQIFRFLSPLSDLASHENPASREAIMKALTSTLVDAGGDELFIFWAGHGMVTEEGGRRLFFADTTQEHMVSLDFEDLLDFTRSSRFVGFQRQYYFVEASAGFDVTLQIRGPEEKLYAAGTAFRSVEQWTIFAAERGDIARQGPFSRELFAALEQIPDSKWPPDMEALQNTVKARVAELTDNAIAQHTPGFYSFRSPGGNVTEIGALSGVPPKLADYVTADGWTLVDRLNYKRYVNALHAFISDPRTIAPLCISVQAPWGGGKTSVMRMVQVRLDRKALEYDNPDALRSFDADIAMRTGTPGKIPPDSVRVLHSQASRTIGHLSIGGVLELINAWKRQPTPTIEATIDVAELSARTCITIWFNAWKYDATNQVWAGLADAIIAQVTRRLSLKQREEFFLKLHLSRIDADKVRAKIYDRIYRLAIQNVGYKVTAWAGGVVAGLSTILVSAATHEGWTAVAGLVLAAITALGGFLQAHRGYKAAEKEVESEKAAATLSDLMTMPSYKSETGFLHGVDADLRRVLALIPSDYWPIVIFIDDLDRTFPMKVAQVMEAVNLFLGGEFARCIFVMAMDPELVAASLDVAHKDVIAALPQDARIPVGWRFMDKFVQLPFIIPAVADDDVRKLATSLLMNHTRLELVHKAAAAVTMDTNDPELIAERASASAREVGLSAEDVESVIAEIRSAQYGYAQEQTIKEFDDNRNDVRPVIDRGMGYFAGNPREIKRFINAFRLHVYLWGDRARVGDSKIGLPAIMRWTVFMMKWPDVMRWVHRAPRLPYDGPTASPGTADTNAAPNGAVWSKRFPEKAEKVTEARAAHRLKQLEQLAVTAKSLHEWSEALQKSAGISPGTRWLFDEELFYFLNESGSEKQFGGALWESVEQGLW